MLRIVHRALALLLCLALSGGLIAARPLPPQFARPGAQPGAALLAAAIPVAGAQRPSASALPARAAASPAATRRATRSSRLAGPDRAPRLRQPSRGELLVALEPTGSAPPPPLEAVLPAHPRIAGDGPWMRGERVAQTARLDLYVGTQTFSADQIAASAPLFELLLRENEARFGTTLEHRVSVGFYRAALAPEEGVRGMAYTSEGRAELFYRPYEDLERAGAVVAHELAHHLEEQRYGERVQRRADTILHEGLATWIVGERWLARSGAASWRERARQLQHAGIPLRLLTAEESGANNAYDLWASFVDFLIERYGRDQFDALYRSGRGRAHGSSDYLGVLGTSLDELADEWRMWVRE